MATRHGTGITGVSLVIPAHNEQGCIADAVDRAHGVLSAAVGLFDVVVVDDGSTDATPRILDALARTHDRLEVVHTHECRGKGHALRSGFARSRMPWIAFVDADLQVPMEALEALLAEADDRTVVVGRKVGARVPPTRVFVSRAYGLLARLLLGVRTHDVGCPLKLFPRALIEGVDLVSDGWVIDAEILGVARARGYRLVEVDAPVDERRSGQSSVSVWTVFESTAAIVRAALAVRRVRRAPQPSGSSPRESVAGGGARQSVTTDRS